MNRLQRIGVAIVVVLESVLVTTALSFVVDTPGIADALPTVPNAPVTVYLQDFETPEVAGTTVPAGVLTAFPSMSSSTYWTNAAACNGIWINYSSPVPPAGFGGCTPGVNSGYDGLRDMANTMGGVNNHVIGAYTHNGITSPTGQLQLGTGNIAVIPGHYYVASVRVGSENCFSNPAVERFVLTDGVTTANLGTSTACPAGGSPTRQVATLIAPNPVRWNSATLRMQLYNDTAAGNGSGDDSAIDDFMLLDVTPALDKSFTPSTVIPGQPSTVTFTITNSSDLLPKPDWSFTDTLPAGVVVAPAPNIGGTCVDTTGTAAFNVAAAAAGTTITVTGGDLIKDQKFCTITVDVVAAGAGTYVNGSGSSTVTTSGLYPPPPATLTVTPAVVRVAKTSVGSVGTFGYTLSGATPNADSITTATSGVKVTSPTAHAASYSDVVVTESSGAAGYSTSSTCVDANAATTGNAPINGTGTSVTIPRANVLPGSNWTCSFSNIRLPVVRVAKVSNGATGTFNFTLGGLSNATDSVVTATAGTTVASAQTNTGTVGTSATVTETAASATGYVTRYSCVDSGPTSNATITGSGTAAVIPGANMQAGANWLCTYTNDKLATLRIVKSVPAGQGTSFDFTQTGVPVTATGAPNAAGLGAFSLNPIVVVGGSLTDTQTYTNVAPGSVISFSEIARANISQYALVSMTCTNAAGAPVGSTFVIGAINNGAAIGSPLGTSTVTLAPGADVTCTFSNVRNPRIVLNKTTLGGDGTFAFTETVTGSGVAVSNPSPSLTTSAGTATTNTTITGLSGAATTTLTITESANAAYNLTDVTCVNLTTSQTLTTATTPSATVNLGSRQVVVTPIGTGAQISCTFTNAKKPTMVIVKRSVGGTGSFNFGSGSNGLPAGPLAISTATTNPSSSSAFTLNAANTSTSITEAIPAGWQLTGVQCVDASNTVLTATVDLSTGALTLPAASVAAGANITCTFTNAKLGSITIVKDAVPNDAQDFSFTSSGAGTSNFILDDDADATRSNNQTFTGLSAGSYPVVEAAAAGWSLTSLTCTGDADAGSVVTLGSRQVAIDLDPGEDITCTFVNTKAAALDTTKVVTTVNGAPATAATQVKAGDVIVYTIVTANTGGATASTTLTDVVPANTTYTGTGEGWSCTAPAAAGTSCTQTVSVPGSSTATRTFTLTVGTLPAGTQTVGNVVASSGGSCSSCNPSNPTVPALNTTKVVSTVNGAPATATTQVKAGDVIVYSIVTTNSGGSAGVTTLTDVVPTNTTYTGAGEGWSCTAPAAAGTSCTQNVNVAANSSVTRTFTLTVGTLPVGTLTVGNVVASSGGTCTSCNPNNPTVPVLNTTKVVTTVNGAAATAATQVKAGDVVVYSIVTTNTGGSVGTTTLTDVVPANTTYTGSGEGWSCSAPAVAGTSCTQVVIVGANSSATRTFTLTVGTLPAGTLTVANLVASNGGTCTSCNPSNPTNPVLNTTKVVTTVNGAAATAATQVKAGDVIVYSIVTTNTGGSVGTTTLTDVVPTNTTYTGAGEGWSCAAPAAAGTSCTQLVSVPANSSVTRTFTLTVGTLPAGTLTVGNVVASTGGTCTSCNPNNPTVPALNTTKVVTTVNGAAANSGTVVGSGDVIVYTIVTTNTGGSAGTTTLTDVVPTNTTYTGSGEGWSCAAPAAAGTSCTQNVNVAANSSVTRTFTLTVGTLPVGTQTVGNVVASSGGTCSSCNPSNPTAPGLNTTKVVTSVNGAAATATTQVKAGDVIVYTIVTSNTGGAAGTTTLTDVVPVNTTYTGSGQGWSCTAPAAAGTSCTQTISVPANSSLTRTFTLTVGTLPAGTLTVGNLVASSGGTCSSCNPSNPTVPVLNTTKVATTVNGAGATPSTQVKAGDVIVYSIVTTNTGGSVGSTTLTDVVPTNTSYTGSGEGWSCAAPAAAGTSCTQLVSVPANSSVTRTFTLTVGTLPAGTQTVGNVVASSGGTCTSCNPNNPTVPVLNTTKVVTTVNGVAATAATQVKAGDVIAYSIVTTNTGGSAGSTTLTDVVPTNTSYTGSGEGWSCTAPAAAGTSCTQNINVPANSSVTQTFTLTVGTLPAGTQTVGNVVASSGGTCSSCNPNNPTVPVLNTTKVVTTVNGAAATAATQVKAGDVIAYTIVTTNTGGSSATTTLTDVVPANTTYTGAAEGWSCTAPAPAGTSCTQNVNVAANSSVTRTFTLTVGTLPAGTQTVGNVVASSVGTCSSCNPNNPTVPVLNTTKVVSTVNGAAATAATQVKAGDVIVYSIVTTNTGGSAGTTTLTDVVPVNTSYTGSGEGWSCVAPAAAGTSCTQVVSVAANSSVTRTFTLTVGTLPAGTQTVGNVVASSGGTCSSCNPNNPTAPVLNTTKVVTSVNGAAATAATQVKAGDVVVYTIVTTNTGGSAGTTTLTDVVPTNTSYTGSGEGWSCVAPAAAGTSCTQTISVPANSSVTRTFTLTVGTLPAGTQTVGNVVASSGGTCSSCNPNNPTVPVLNTTKVVTTVNGAAASAATQVKAGDVVVYSIVTTNTGGSIGSTTLTDVVPTNTTYTGTGEGWSCTAPAAAGTSCTQLISVPANGSITRTFTLTVGALPAGTQTVANLVASTGGTCTSCNPSNPTNPVLNTTKVVTTVNGAAASAATQVKAGDVIVYTIVTTNSGGSAGSTTLTDVVPTNTSYTGSGEGWSCTAPAAAGTSCTQNINVPANGSVTNTFTLTVGTLPVGTLTVGNVVASTGGTCSSCNPSNPTTPALNTTKVVTTVNGSAATSATVVGTGDVIMYTIVTTNTGGSAGTTTLTDVVPANTTYTGTAEGWSCSAPAPAGTSCTQNVNVAANSSVTRTFTLTVGTLPAGTLTVGNVVASSGGTCSSCNPSNPTTPGLNTTKVVTTVNGAAATAATQVKAGDVVVYTIVTTNTGGSAGTTTLTDVVPVNTSYTGSGEGWSCVAPAAAGTSCTQTISVPANSAVTRTFTLTVGTLPAGTLTVGNLVASSAGTCSSCNPNNPTVPVLDSTKVVTTVNGVAATAATQVKAGDVVVYSIVTTNTGGSAGTTTLTDVVPVNTTYTGTGEGWSCAAPAAAGTSCTQNINVPANSSVTRTFTLTVGALPAGTLTVGNVVASSGGTCTSCNPNNPTVPVLNTTKVVTTVNGVAATAATQVKAGDVVVYSIVTTNTGGSIGSTTLTDVVPTNTSYTGSGEGWSCTAPAAAGTSCTQLVSVPANGSITQTFTLTVGVLPAGTQTVGNVVASSGGTCTSCNPNNPTVPVLDTTKVVTTVNGATATAATQVKAGDVIAYTIVTTNTGGSAGTTTLTDIVPTNTSYTGSAEGWSCTAPAAAGTSCTQNINVPANSSVTRTFTLTVGSLPAGTITVGNVVASSGGTCSSCNPNNPTVPVLDTTKVVSTVNGAAATAATQVKAGDVVVYSIVTTNTGGTLASTTLTDVVPVNTSYTGSAEGWSCTAPSVAGTSCTQTVSVAANSSVTRTFTLTVGVLPAGTLTVGNVVASSGGTCSSCNPNNPTVPVLDTTKVVTTVNGQPATTSTPVFAGDTVVYTIVTTNTGGSAGTTTLSDVVPANTTYTGSGEGWSCTAPSAAGTSCTQTITVPANSSVTRTFTLTVGALPPAATNVANVVTSTGGTCSSCTPSNPVARPSISIDKTADLATYTAVGNVITYSFAVTNTGNVPLTAVTITDALPGLSAITCSPIANGSIVLAVGQSTADLGVTCSATYTIGQPDLDAGHVTNAATATGTPPRGPDVTATDGVTVPATTSTGITLAKTVYLGHDAGASAPGGELVTGIAGTPITYVFTITNTSTVTLFGVTLTDPLLGIASNADVVVLSGNPAVLLPGASVTFYVETTMTTDLLNTATAAADVPGGDLTDPSDDITTTDTASVDVVAPSVSLVKVARGTADGAVHNAAYGAPVTFDFTITNTGDTALGSVTLVDNTCSPISIDPDPNGNGRLDVGEVWTGTCTLAAVFTDFVNVADVTGNPVDGSGADLPGVPDVHATDDATVDVLGEIAVDKTDPTITFDPGTGQYTAVYTITVTNAGADTTYALADSLRFGAAVSVLSASITVDQVGIIPSATWNGLTDTAVVAAAPIAHAATHTYTVTVVATVDPATATSTAGNCIIEGGETGTGFLNEASATAEGSTATDTGCGSVPDPQLTIAKSVTAGPIDNGDGTSSLTYQIVVTNTADGPGRYDLDDQLHFGSGIAVVSVAVANSSPGSIPTNAGFDASTDTRIATAVAIAGRATHTYSVTVVANTLGLTTATAADCTVDAGETGTGFRNETTLTTGAGSQTANACEPAPLPDIVVTKTVSGAPVLQADGRFLIGYDIDVTNSGAGWGTYTLDDSTHFPAGVTVDSATVSNTIPGGLSADPLPAIVTVARTLAPGGLHRYHVDVLSTVAPSVPDSVRDCGAGSPPDLGFMNEATVHVLDGDETAAACAPIPKAIVSITKTVVGPATVDATGAFTRTYEIRVANTGDGAGLYDLADTLMFGDGITIDAAVMTDPNGVIVAGWNGTTVTSVVNADPIAAQTQEVYTVTVTGSVAGATSIEATDCELATTESGTGFLNTAALTFSNTTTTALACEPEPDPDIHIAKSAATPVHGTDGRDTITYMISATNTGGAGTYDLTDSLSFGGAITIISATATTVSGPNPASASWNGVDDTTVTTAVFIPAGGIHSYRVIVVVDPLLVTPGEGACTGGPGASGYLNTATLNYAGTAVDDSACQPVADPNLSVAKTVTGTVLNGDGTSTVTYDVVVTNVGDGPGRYTLTDQLRFGAGIAVDSATATATSTAMGDTPVVSSTWDGVTDLTLVADQPIRGHATHTYTVVVTANTEDVASTTAADCSLDTGETGTGLRNDATLTSPAGRRPWTHASRRRRPRSP